MAIDDFEGQGQTPLRIDFTYTAAGQEWTEDVQRLLAQTLRLIMTQLPAVALLRNVINASRSTFEPMRCSGILVPGV